MYSNSSEQYGLHPSRELNELFSRAELPFQGQNPREASVVFIGLDANYSSALSLVPNFFDYILEYHADAVAFWQKYGVHHPFLLECYPLKKNTGGVPFHKNFSKMGLNPSFASRISFLELIPHPTTGRTTEAAFWGLFDSAHASRVDSLICEGQQKLIVLSSSVMQKMVKARGRYPVFEWLPESFRLGEMKRIDQTVIYGAPHFSSAVTNKALIGLGKRIREFCASEAK